MSDQYCFELSRIAVAQIAQTIGYNSTLTAPLEILQDVLLKFMQEFGRSLHRHTEHANRSEPTLRDANMSLKNLNINITELLDYISNVDPVPFAKNVPAFPIKGNKKKISFLKPDCAETLTRTENNFEYLQPMLQTNSMITSPTTERIDLDDSSTLERRFMSQNAETKSTIDLINLNPTVLPIHDINDENVSTRELSSVFMTPDGRIVSTIEGKLAEIGFPKTDERFSSNDVPASPSLSQPTVPNPDVPNLDSFGNKKCVEKPIHVPPYEVTGEQSHSEAKRVSDVTTAVVCSKTTSKGKHKPPSYEGVLGNDSSSISKAREKEQRKAAKMQNKLSKSANSLRHLSGSVDGIKKSKKPIDQGIIASLSNSSTEKLPFEKLIRKQEKQKLKQFKLQKKQQLESMVFADPDSSVLRCKKSDSPVISPAPHNFASSPLLHQNISSLETHIVSSRDCISPITIIEPTMPKTSNTIGGGDGNDVFMSTEVKLSSEPDQNKLNIFKKISKQKCVKPLPNPRAVLSLATNLHNNHDHSDATMINLPIGTTITPAPALSDNEMHDILLQSCEKKQMSLQGDLTLLEASKPKKRGRKPGSKNQVKYLSELSSTKKIKNTKESIHSFNTTNLQSQSMQQVTMPMLVPLGSDTMNLSNMTHMQGGVGSNIKTKVDKKKERKKVKYNSLDVMFNNELMKQEQIPFKKKMDVIPVGPPNETKTQHSDMQTDGVASNPQNNHMDLQAQLLGARCYAANQSNIFPMLPLLQFPPRPGLIPTGPTLFSSSFTSNLPCNAANTPNMLMNTAFMRFPNANNPHDIKSANDAVKFSLLDSNADRNYCNVAPLVPDSMKILKADYVNVPQPETLNKLPNVKVTKPPETFSTNNKSSLVAVGTGQLGDPIEVSDDDSNQEKTFIQSQPTHFQQSTSPQSPSSSQQFSTSIHGKISREPINVQDLQDNANISDNADSKKIKKQFKTASKIQQSEQQTLSTAPIPPFNINFLGNDKFSLAGGADLIPLSCVDTGTAYSVRTVPATSLSVAVTAGLASPNSNSTFVAPFNDPANFASNFNSSKKYDDVTITPTQHNSSPRKEHKKLKKLKDGKIKKKKEKKDKSKSKPFIDDNKHTQKLERPKGLEKKLKKEKKKNKQVSGDISLLPGSAADYDEAKNATVASNPPLVLPPVNMPVPSLSAAHVSPNSFSSVNQVPKLTLKFGGKSTPLPYEYPTEINTGLVEENKRQQSPELARFSPLVTGPPKPKQVEPQPVKGIISTNTSDNTTDVCLPSNNWVSSGTTLAASAVLLPQQLMQAPKASHPLPSIVPTARTENPQSVPQVTESNRPSSYVDAEGNRIWICPACGKVDDGSAMIGCDGCDAWYHWICVGIFVAPKDNEDWFCRVCITRKKIHGSEKRKKRNRKNEKQCN